MTTQSLDLNLIPKGISPRLYVSQYDKGQTWTFNIYAGNTAYTIPNGATVTIQGTKPDKTGFQYSCTVSGNVVTATEQQQMTVIAGEVPAEIRITNNNEIIATLNFILVVEPAALTDETEISETDLPIIEQAIEMLPHYQEMIDEVSSQIGTLSNVRAELGAHNLLKNTITTQTRNGVTYTVNSDGSITVSGTATSETWTILTDYKSFDAGSYILSGCPSGGSASKYFVYSEGITGYDYGNGVTISIPSSTPIRFGMCIKSGQTVSNLVFKPMLRLASDSDPTYQPYAKPNTELTKDTTGLTDNQFENGAVNMLENKASSTVVDGIAFTVNADKSISVYGTLGANASASFIINNDGVYSNFIGKRLKLSGCPKDTGLSQCRITAYRVESADGSSGSVFDTGDGVVYEHLNNGTGTKARYQIEIYNNTSSAMTVNTTFKPMITVADMPNSDYAHYVPYAKSNRELTHLIKKKTATVTTSSNGNASIATDLVPYSAQILAINVTSGAENGAIAVAYKNLGASVNSLHVWSFDGTTLTLTQIGIEIIYIDGADVT